MCTGPKEETLPQQKKKTEGDPVCQVHFDQELHTTLCTDIQYCFKKCHGDNWLVRKLNEDQKFPALL